MSLERLCGLFGKTRQVWYAVRKRNFQAHYQEELIVEKVIEIRQTLKNAGVRKLYIYLQDFFDKHQMRIGRDKLFDILRHHQLLIKRSRRGALTTNSRHSFRKFANKIKDIQVDTPNQVWVSDMTYIRVFNNNGFSYLSLVTDAYSKKIVGWKPCKLKAL